MNTSSRTALTVLIASAPFILPSAVGDVDRADDHAPIGVMADHTHKQGEWMFSYRHMTMTMRGNRDGDDRLSLDEVLRSGSGTFRVAPKEMTMTMHMLGAMYAPTHKITLMAMMPYVSSNRMDHVTAMGGQFETESNGLGDIGISALFPVFGDGTASVGIIAPTGKTNHRDLTPMGESVLPYPMQIGSGSWSASGALTWNRQFERASFGAQARGFFRITDNDHEYRLGDRVEASLWGAVLLHRRISLSLRAKYSDWGDVEGADPRYAGALAANLVPTVDPKRQGGEHLEAIAGANFTLGRHRFGIEWSLPLYRDLNGPKLETDTVLAAGWQFSLE